MSAKRRPPTMTDVGDMAGVTDRTVSNVLSGKVPVSPQTREAVLRAVQELGYQMNLSAQSLRTGQTGAITLALPDLTIDYFAQLANTIVAEAERSGWSVNLQLTGTHRHRELALLSGADRQLSDGLILLPHGLEPGDQKLLGANLPVVLLGERVFGGPVDHITMANRAAAQAATEHLLDSGCRRVVALGPNPADSTTTTATLRLDGYRRALKAAGITEDPELIAPATIWNQAHGVDAVEALLDHGVPFDGIFCFNDTLAFGALHALNRREVAVPGQVAVIGFDNVTATAYTNPPLTSVDPGVAEIAKVAVQRLVNRIRGTLQDPPGEFITDFSIVRRVST